MSANRNLRSAIYFATALITIISFSCANRNAAKKGDTDTLTTKPVFAMVSLPSTLSSPQDRANYLAEHYWDKFDFADTSFVSLPEVTEQAFVDYVNILPHASEPVIKKSITGTIENSKKGADGKMYDYFVDMFEKYLYDPNSPMRNDELYIHVAEYMANDNASDEAAKMRAEHNLVILKRNRPGNIANDFTYTLKSGKKGTLHKISSPSTLILFYNPDCNACADIMKYIKSSPVFNQLLSEKMLAILAFYPDAELEIWENHLTEIPVEWINGYDKSLVVKNNDVYDLKAIPTLYLLDKDKRVILKDTNIDVAEQFLYNNPL